MKDKIYVRADGDSEIGLGHIVRCMALGHMLKSDFEIHFVCKKVPERSKEEIIQAQFLFLAIENEKDFLGILTGKEIVVLDHYELDSSYQRTIKEIGCKLVCIDDLHDKAFYADLIINHSLEVKPRDYIAQNYTKFALGLDYALLRPPFLEEKNDRPPIEKIETAFICFGGSDSNNLTSSTLEVLIEINKFKKIIVILGPLYKHKNQLMKTIGYFSLIKIHQAISAKEMICLMKESELAIIPASGTLFEALRIGLPVITGYFVPNQKNAAKAFCEEGLAFWCDNLLENYKENLKQILNTVSLNNVNSMLLRQSKLFNKSVNPHLKVFKELI